MAELITLMEEDKKLIQRAYRQLLRSIKANMDATDRKNIRMAYEIAVDAHSQQRRKSGEPYILHPIEVARICVEEIGLGPTAVVCALLHDVVEDTDVSLDDIRERFGERIATIVDGLTKLDNSFKSDSPQAENFKKVLSTLVDDVRVVLIKMADRLHNMRTLGSMPREKQLKIAAETSYIYAPLAHRLGLYAIKTEFQDLCMKIQEPEAYKEIANKLKETKRDRTRYISEFVRPLTKPLDELGVPYRIQGRPKAIYSIWNKIQKKGDTFEEIYDLFAVRIIVDVEKRKEKMLCWQIYSIVTEVYQPIAHRLKDWITMPKSNGYESLHTTVIGPKERFVEVQIRSERMDEIAERGFAAHWKYKGSSSDPDVFEKWLDNIRDILDTPSADAQEFISDFKTNLFNDEVFVHTKTGEVRALPQGASALDFAFNIHSDVGYHCAAVKVNNRLVSLQYKLQNGDRIEVITNKNQRPTEAWLKMVITGKARSKIRSAMKEERRKQGELGKEALERKLRNMKVHDFEAAVELLVKHFGLSSHVDLYYTIAMEEITLSDDMKAFLVENGKLVLREKPSAPNPEPEGPKPAPAKAILAKPGILVGGEPVEQYKFSLATCCNPVQGDDIFGFITATQGLKIHRTNCPNAANMMANYDYKVMKAEWTYATSSQFVVTLKVTGIDEGPGIIQRLTNVISSNLEVNIRSFNIEGLEGYYEGRISLLVQNTNQLNQVIRNLQKLDIVSTVSRIE
jgi:guanosine-3',5'-bis(diphosphate) 3'-pyrophosphohydrolase